MISLYFTWKILLVMWKHVLVEYYNQEIIISFTQINKHFEFDFWCSNKCFMANNNLCMYNII